jgi:hypothetical protein
MSLNSFLPNSPATKKKNSPTKTTAKTASTPTQQKRNSPKNKSAATPKLSPHTKKNNLKKPFPTKAATSKKKTNNAQNKRPPKTAKIAQTTPATELLCYLGDRCLSTTNKITFMHRCSSCQAAMHVICGEVDENNSSWCFNCIDNHKTFSQKLISKNRATLMDHTMGKEYNHPPFAATNNDNPTTTQQLLKGAGDESPTTTQQLTNGARDDAATLTLVQKMQQQILALQQEKEDQAKQMLTMAQGVAQKMDKGSKAKPTKENKVKGKPAGGKQKAATQTLDDTSVEDSTIDYTLEENWSVKCFIGHTIKLKGDKGPPTIQLKATWKGYEGEQPTMEPWGKMKKHHSRQLKRYVKKHPDLKDAVTTYQLFNKL